MQFPAPLVPGRLIRRYKRFLSDVELADGAVITAHCPNPGSMMGLAEPGMAVWLSRSDNPTRKLAWSWELVAPERGEADLLVGINTGRPNALVAAAIEDGRVAELAGYQQLRREVRYGEGSRIDLLLESPQPPDRRPPCYVEIKSVTLKRGARSAEFPDAVTARGTRHLDELARMVAQGARAVLFFLVQRRDCADLAIAADIDPAYARAFRAARDAGVEIIAYDCDISPTAIRLGGRLPLAPLTDIGPDCGEAPRL
jgi:sugar fermentation stimulation protein A